MIQWEAGGSTRHCIVSIAPYVEKELGNRSLILTNKTGALAPIATKYVKSLKSRA